MIDDRKARARSVVRSLRDDICAAFEALEDEAARRALSGEPPAASCARHGSAPTIPAPRRRRRHGDACAGGCSKRSASTVSTVHGEFAPEFRSANPGRRRRSALLGLRHFADRPSAQPARAGRAHEHPLRRHHESWFGGGADLTPVLDRRRTPGGSRHACLPCRDAGGLRRAIRSADYASYKAWCDEYFCLPHRKEPRGIGGIFYDYHNSGDWDADFAFTQDVGRALPGHLSRARAPQFRTPWTEAERDEQLVRRGRYVEFNLLYDRGTMFGLKTGGNVETILSSMPPVVKWP